MKKIVPPPFFFISGYAGGPACFLLKAIFVYNKPSVYMFDLSMKN